MRKYKVSMPSHIYLQWLVLHFREKAILQTVSEGLKTNVCCMFQFFIYQSTENQVSFPAQSTSMAYFLSVLHKTSVKYIEVWGYEVMKWERDFWGLSLFVFTLHRIANMIFNVNSFIRDARPNGFKKCLIMRSGDGVWLMFSLRMWGSGNSARTSIISIIPKSTEKKNT